MSMMELTFKYYIWQFIQMKSFSPNVAQKIRAVLVLYLLSGIRILVCLCTGCGTSKFICVSKITGHHFRGWVENPKLRTPVHKQEFSSACTKYVLRKTKIYIKQLKLNKFIFDVKQLKINKFIFDVKQLKMNRFIKSILDFIISTSNATPEVPSLHPRQY